MVDWNSVLLVILGGSLTIGGGVVAQIWENKREAKKEQAREKEGIRAEIMKSYIEEGISAIQKDLARGANVVADIEDNLLRARVMYDEFCSISPTLFEDILLTTFKPDPLHFIGISRLADFSEASQQWALCGYRGIDLYILIAHDAANRMLHRMKNNQLTENDWKIVSHLFVEGELWFLTVGTVLDIIRDLDTLAVLAKDIDYPSLLDPVIKFKENPEFKYIDKFITEKVEKFRDKEKKGLANMPKESDGGNKDD